MAREYWRDCSNCGHERYFKTEIEGVIDCPNCGHHTWKAYSLKKVKKLSYKGIMRGAHGRRAK
jgi:DNA-directed RNA polymerase subunit RPC12/RpoP